MCMMLSSKINTNLSIQFKNTSVTLLCTGYNTFLYV